MAMTAIEYVDRPPPGWFVLDVMRRKTRSREWAALMVDFDPDDPNCVGPPAGAHNAWVRITGKHRDRDAAWDALEQMMATRH
jgi:hypothetical protein